MKKILSQLPLLAGNNNNKNGQWIFTQQFL